MKTLPIVLAMIAFATSSFATVIQIPGTGMDMPKNGTASGGGNGNSAADNFFRLQTVVSSLSGYPTPLLAGSLDLGSNVVSNDLLLGFEYAVLHYGVGNGGAQGSGGGVEIFYISGGQGNFTFPALGTGPNGFGGFSGGTLFNSNATPGNVPGPTAGVPDAGSSALLLGFAVVGLAGLRRLFRK